jgi:hypothetical protein
VIEALLEGDFLILNPDGRFQLTQRGETSRTIDDMVVQGLLTQTPDGDFEIAPVNEIAAEAYEAAA